MRKRDIKAMINNELENTYHMNQNAEYSKRNLSFSKHDNNFLAFHKLKFVGICVSSLFATVALSSVATLYINHILMLNKNQFNFNSFDEIVSDANDYIKKYCKEYYSYPIASNTIGNTYYLNIYQGTNLSEENIKTKFFFQIGNYFENKFKVSLKFYIDEFSYKEFNITKYTIKELNINEGKEIEHLYVDFYESESSPISIILI